jgi:hypothetical protein
VKRRTVIQEVKEEVWNRRVKEVFPALLKQTKVDQEQAECTQIGDMVLRRDETAAGQTH